MTELVIGMLSSRHMEVGMWSAAAGLCPAFLVEPRVSWPGFGVALWSSSKFLEKIGDVEIKNGKIKCKDAMRYLAGYKIFFLVTLFLLFMSLLGCASQSTCGP